MNIRAQILGAESDDYGPPLLKKKRSKGAKGDTLTTVAITREETRRSNSRGEDRHVLREHTSVRFRNGEHKVEIINLSDGGAMIEGDLAPNITETLELRLGEGNAVECLVRWVKDGRIGLEFAHETQLNCSTEEQAELLREVIHKGLQEETFASDVAAQEGREDRSTTRHPLIWSGELVHGSERWKVRLRNISATGALAEFPGQLRLGSEVLLDLGRAGAIRATVSWAMGDHLGLEFVEVFDMIRLSQAQVRVAPPTWLMPAYLETDGAVGSAWDEAWSRLSIDELRSTLEGYLKR